jgi:hypothetical protein
VLDFATNAARSVLGHMSIGTIEHRVEHLVPIEERLHEAVDALHRTADSMERNVEVAEKVAESLPALTEAVTRLCDQLARVLELATPVEAAEHEVSSGLGKLFRRHRRAVRDAGA